MKHDLSLEKIRIGTLAGKGKDTPAYLKQILPHGFESFQINFWQKLDGVDLQELGKQTLDVLAEEGSGAIISSIGMFGNPMGETELDAVTLEGLRLAIDNASAFGTNLVCGFTGRVRGASIPDSIPRFKEVWGDLARRAADKGVKLAFENCAMGGNWKSGDWNIAHNPAAWELMFDAVPDANVGLEWEPCHQMCELIDPMPQLREWVAKGKIFHVHGKDATIHWDLVKKYGIGGCKNFVHHRTPGFGDCNWTDIISDLRIGGFTGSIDIEGWHDPIYKGDLEMTGQVHGLNYLKHCRGGYFVPNPV
ncbi:MAG: sugar phosphate isomerase/epimerase family protein [Candidatus Methylacidiphilales bacterium]